LTIDRCYEINKKFKGKNYDLDYEIMKISKKDFYDQDLSDSENNEIITKLL